MTTRRRMTTERQAMRRAELHRALDEALDKIEGAGHTGRVALFLDCLHGSVESQRWAAGESKLLLLIGG